MLLDVGSHVGLGVISRGLVGSHAGLGVISRGKSCGTGCCRGD